MKGGSVVRCKSPIRNCIQTILRRSIGLKKTSVFLTVLLVATLLVSSLGLAATIDSGPIWRPSSPLYEEVGVAGVYYSLMKLPIVASFASIGAHPDDDDSALLAYVSRGMLARTANTVITRGDGGQNAIGPELYQGLGVVRTEELLSARRLDGAEQYFTRGFDFGFSKTWDETMRLWGEETVLEDLVRFIRAWRPDVILNHHAREFETESGHGHHQATGYILPKAIQLAADPNAFPEMLAEGLLPWKTPKVYLRGAAPNGVAHLEIDRGEYNPILGRSYNEIGSESRSYHRTQTMGRLQDVGTSPTKFYLESSTVGYRDKETSFFDGIDSTISGIARYAGEEEHKTPLLRSSLLAVEKQIEKAIAVFNPLYPETIVPHLIPVLSKFREIKNDVLASSLSADKQNYLLFYLDQKIEETQETIMKAAGLKLEVFSDEELYIPGETLAATLRIINRSDVPVTLREVGLRSGQTSVTKELDHYLVYNTPVTEKMALDIPMDTPTSRVFWALEAGRPGSLGSLVVDPLEYHMINQPFRPYPVSGFAKVTIAGEEVNLVQFSQYRIRDTVTGEFRDPTAVVAPISVRLTPDNRVVTQRPEDQTVEFTVRVVNNLSTPRNVTVELVTSELMVVEPSRQIVSFTSKGEAQNVDFTVTIPAGIPNEEYNVQAVVTDGNMVYSDGYQTIKYPHIERHHLYSPATSSIVLFDLEIDPDLSIGYIMGPDDGIHVALSQVGIDVVLIEEGRLDTIDLSQFDTIVTARFAYEFRDDLVANNARLLKWVEDGGVLIVQYNRGAWNKLNVSPYPTVIRNDRVTDEDAKVDLLVPEHPIFNYPNLITDEDFEGWHQERGLYFLGEWDERYIPLMASNDTGDTPQLGGMVWTPYGKGGWLYTGYAFFRQIPGGVPGGFRLFSNMLSLPKYIK